MVKEKPAGLEQTEGMGKVFGQMAPANVLEHAHTDDLVERFIAEVAVIFQFNGDPADKAALILSSLQGALQMARALGAEKFHAVVEQHKRDMLV